MSIYFGKCHIEFNSKPSCYDVAMLTIDWFDWFFSTWIPTKSNYYQLSVLQTLISGAVGTLLTRKYCGNQLRYKCALNLTWILHRAADPTKVSTLTQIPLALRSRRFKTKGHLFTLLEEVSGETKQDKQEHLPPCSSETLDVLFFPFFWPAVHMVPQAETHSFSQVDPLWHHMSNTAAVAMLWGA